MSKNHTRSTLFLFVATLLCTQAAAAPPALSSHDLTLSIEQLARAANLARAYWVEDQVARDFNGDGVNDLAIVIRATTPDERNLMGQRKLVIGLWKGTAFHSVQSSHCLAMCKHCGGIMGDPFQGISVRGKASLAVINYGGSRHRWSNQFTVLWRKNGFYVVGVDTSVYDSLRPEKEQKTSVNLLNRKYIRTGMVQKKSHRLKPLRIEDCNAIERLYEPNLD